MKKLNVKAFALAFGVSFGLYAMFLGWTAAYGWGTPLVQLASSLYIGYAPGFVGGIVGGIWAFIDWAIGAAIIAWIYNALNKR